MPSGSIYQELKDIIFELSKEHGTVDFEPHVTIVGGLVGDETKLIKKTQELGKIVPFKVSLGKLQQSDEYFKSIFLECKRSKELMGLNQKTRVLFNKLADPEFKPHLSLLYSELKSEAREKIVDSLKSRFRSSISFGVSNIRFMLTAQHPAIELKKFEFDKDKGE